MTPKHVILLLLVFFASVTPAPAQDIENMLEKLKRIEEKLKTLEAPNQADKHPQNLQTISQDVAFIRSELEKQATAGMLANDLKMIVHNLETRLQNLPQSVEAEDIQTPTSHIAISGFGDVLRILRQGDSFALGQVEVDIEANIEKVVVATAIAYDGSAFGLGAFEVILPLWGNTEGHFKTVQEIFTSELSFGQFDVPFGLDYHVYPSIDRKLITSPRVVEQTHNSWNDFGVRGHLETNYFKIDLFGTNGFGYHTTDPGANPPEIEVNPKVALGGRLGIMPITGFEIGGSVAGIWNENDDLGVVLIGFDAQMAYHKFVAKGEYIWHQTDRPSPQRVTNKGLYGQAMLVLDPVFLVGRYDHFWPEWNASESRFSAGIGYAIVEGCEIRTEYQFNLNNMPDIGFVQMVVGF